MAVEPNIKKKADDIRNKIYGKEVRESLASGLEAMSSDVVENEGRQSVVESRQDSVESQWQSVSDEMTDKDIISAPEIITARNGEANLKARLDKENQEVTAQLAQTNTHINNGNINPMFPPFPLVASEFDGVTDDTDSLQAIINYAVDNNLSISFPSQKITKANISLPNKTVLFGNFSTIIKQSSGSLIDGGEDLYIENLYLDGNKDTVGGGKGDLGLSVGGGSIIRNITSNNNAGHGIRIYSWDKNKKVYGYNLVVNNNGVNPTPTGSGTGDGLYMSNSFNVYLDGVTAFNNARTGVVATTYNSDTATTDISLSDNINISNVTYGNNAYGGLNMEVVSRPTIIGVKSVSGAVSARASKEGVFKYLDVPYFAASQHNDINVQDVILSPYDNSSNVFHITGNNPVVNNVKIKDTAINYSSNTFEVVSLDNEGIITNIDVEKGYRAINISDCKTVNGLKVKEFLDRGVTIFRGDNKAVRINTDIERVEIIGGLLRRTHNNKPGTGRGLEVGYIKGDFVYNDYSVVIDVFGWVCVDEANQKWESIPFDLS